jgi:DNA-binding transcriptional LysR family regulator
VRLAADNMQMLLAAALAGAGVTYGQSFVFGEASANGNLNILMSNHRTSEGIHALYQTKLHVSSKLRDQDIERFLAAGFGKDLLLEVITIVVASTITN